MPIATVNPATGETLATFDPLTEAELDERLERASVAARRYRRIRMHERTAWLRAAADLLDDEAVATSRLLTTEMGKTRKAAEAEVHKCATACRFFADHGPSFLADEPADAGAVGAAHACVRYEPLGVVLAVMPWNFPLWQVIRFAAPALVAGNVGLLKHASNVPQTALYLEDVLLRAGFPRDVFQTLLIGSDAVARVLRDPRVAAATLTGSEPAGRSIARVAGEEIKPTVLELGGSDAYVVMPSADVARAAEVAVTARCQNNGQSCIAAKRFIVHVDVAAQFEREFVRRMSALRVGDPLDDDTDIGPLATAQGVEDVEALVTDAVAHGARLLCGGARLDGPGWFYPPTVVSGVTREMRMYHEEVFGPVASLFVVGSLDEAIEVANDTRFGLGSNVWTRDEDEAAQFVEESAAGAVFVNGMTTSYPSLPFGGVKASGYGRELAAPGIRAFCNVKTVWIGGD